MATISSWQEAIERLCSEVVNEFDTHSTFSTPEGQEIAEKLVDIFQRVNKEVNS